MEGCAAVKENEHHTHMEVNTTNMISEQHGSRKEV